MNDEAKHPLEEAADNLGRFLGYQRSEPNTEDLAVRAMNCLREAARDIVSRFTALEQQVQDLKGQTAGEQRRGSESGAGLTDLAKGRGPAEGTLDRPVRVAPDPALSVPELERWVPDYASLWDNEWKCADHHWWNEKDPSSHELDARHAFLRQVGAVQEAAHTHYSEQLSRLTEALAAEREKRERRINELTAKQMKRANDAEGDVLRLTAERDALKRKVTGLRQGKGERERRINELTAENTDLRKRVSAAEERSVELRVERDKLQAQARIAELEARPVAEVTDEELVQLYQDTTPDGFERWEYRTAAERSASLALMRAAIALATREPKGAVRWSGTVLAQSDGSVCPRSDFDASRKSAFRALPLQVTRGTLHCVLVPDAKEGDDAE